MFTSLLGGCVQRRFLQLFLSALCTAPLNYFQFISFSGGSHTGGVYCSTFPDNAISVCAAVSSSGGTTLTQN